MDCLLFVTERLFLRQLHLPDFESYFELESNAGVMKYISGRPRSRREAGERFFNQIQQYSQDPGFGNFAVCLKENEQFIGTANLNYIPETSIRHIGYRISPVWQGKGLATELAVNLIRYGFEVCKLLSLSAVCKPANKASEKVMQKVGLEFVEKACFAGNECLHYRIESQKWFLKKKQSCSFTGNDPEA